MIKTWIKVIIYAVIAVALATTTTVAALQGRHLKDVRLQVAEQSRVIDSLLTIRRTFMDVELNVTDKSVAKIYGRYNHGTISMPQERVYKLVIDSTNVKIR